MQNGVQFVHDSMYYSKSNVLMSKFYRNGLYVLTLYVLNFSEGT